MYTAFRPGKFWYDNNRKKIEAHGGSILYADNKFWWYGENKEGVTGKATGEVCPYRHKGAKVYSSEDLYNWKDEGYLIRYSRKRSDVFYYGSVADRPHVLYNAKTKKYVCWTKVARNMDFNHAVFAVCVGDSLTTMKLRGVVEPTPHYAGDLDLFEMDGKGYVVFENPHSCMVVRELTEDYTGLTDRYSEHLHLGTPPFVREAPAHFERNGRHYLLTSGTTSYYPNASITYDITDLHGQWKDLGKTCVDDHNNDSFCAQFSSVFQHPGKKEVYIALGDRWLTDMPLDMPNMDRVFEGGFAGKSEYKLPKVEQEKLTDRDISQATYVWLPVQFNDEGIPYIRWIKEWEI